MKSLLFLFVFSFFLTACSIFGRKDYEQQLKSPCVDNGGPCKHIPVNNWWLPTELQYNTSYNV